MSVSGSVSVLSLSKRPWQLPHDPDKDLLEDNPFILIPETLSPRTVAAEKELQERRKEERRKAREDRRGSGRPRSKMLTDSDTYGTPQKSSSINPAVRHSVHPSRLALPQFDA